MQLASALRRGGLGQSSAQHRDPNEQVWHPDRIELQLAHAERNKVRGAYNKAQRIAERRKMMQAWADHLDGLKATGNVVPIR
jgi:hypothetical protein